MEKPVLLPQQVKALERDRQARLRQVRLGLLPPGKMRERDRTGHGSDARYHQHIQDKETPCLACKQAHTRATYGYPEAPSDFAEEQWGAL